MQFYFTGHLSIYDNDFSSTITPNPTINSKFDGNQYCLLFCLFMELPKSSKTNPPSTFLNSNITFSVASLTQFHMQISFSASTTTTLNRCHIALIRVVLFMWRTLITVEVSKCAKLTVVDAMLRASNPNLAHHTQ